MRIRCWIKGKHDWQKAVDGSQEPLVYQKGDRQGIDFYGGKLYVCQDCGQELYVGPRSPYRKAVVTMCNRISEFDGTQYREGPMVRGVRTLWPILRRS